MDEADWRQRFREVSYDRHEDHYDDEDADPVAAEEWLERDTVDAWRHRRMYRAADPLLEADPGAEWLTVGDGRYGNEAKYLGDAGADALPTDISTDLLAAAREAGYIDEYRQENAESLSFDDDAFDYVLCKESYHHFPRPAVALYEMLRVARKGVLFIEPQDAYVERTLRQRAFTAILERVTDNLPSGLRRNDFEESGNYKYTVSRRELEKVSLGLNHGTIAFKGINDAYVSGAEDESLSEKGEIQRRVRRRIRVKDALCRAGLINHSLLAAVLFPGSPSASVRSALRNAGYRVVDLPDNPHV